MEHSDQMQTAPEMKGNSLFVNLNCHESSLSDSSQTQLALDTADYLQKLTIKVAFEVLHQHSVSLRLKGVKQENKSYIKKEGVKKCY